MATEFAFKATGTSWVITILDEISDKYILQHEITERIEVFEQTYSRFRDDSLVTEMSRTAGAYTLLDDAKELFKVYKKLYEVTGGIVTPLIGKTLSEAGYDTSYSLKPKEKVSSAPKWENVIDYVHPILKIKEPVMFDFGAAGKGYIVDLVAIILDRHNVKNYMINAGGDIKIRGKTMRVGLENPSDPKQAIGVAEITNKSICGSSGNRRAWGKYTHIINPKTAESPKNILAVWTVADSTILADGLATALFFVDPKTLSMFDFEYAIVYNDKTVKHPTSFPGRFFSV